MSGRLWVCICDCSFMLCVFYVWLRKEEKESYCELVPLIVNTNKETAKTVEKHEKLEELLNNCCNLRLQVYFQYWNCVFLNLAYNDSARFLKIMVLYCAHETWKVTKIIEKLQKMNFNFDCAYNCLKNSAPSFIEKPLRRMNGDKVKIRCQ